MCFNMYLFVCKAEFLSFFKVNHLNKLILHITFMLQFVFWCMILFSEHILPQVSISHRDH